MILGHMIIGQNDFVLVLEGQCLKERSFILGLIKQMRYFSNIIIKCQEYDLIVINRGSLKACSLVSKDSDPRLSFMMLLEMVSTMPDISKISYISQFYTNGLNNGSIVADDLIDVHHDTIKAEDILSESSSLIVEDQSKKDIVVDNVDKERISFAIGAVILGLALLSMTGLIIGTLIIIFTV